MKYINILLLCALMMSCKQGMFLKRKYTNGFYFSKSKTLHLKEIQAQNTGANESAATLIEKNVSHEPLTDTIILNNGKRIPCKVTVIERDRITYTDNVPGYWGPEKFVSNKKTKRIDFKGNRKEYFTEQNPNGNPLLQYNLFDDGNRRNGMAIFGGVVTLVTGMFLFAASVPLGLLVTVIGLTTLIMVTSAPTNSGRYKGFNALGRTLGIIALLILFIAFIALIALF